MSSVDEMLDQSLFRIGTTQTTVGSLLAVLGIAIGTIVLARLGRKAAYARSLRRNDDDFAGSRTLGVLAQLLIWFTGLELVLHLLGVHLAALFAAGGLFAFGAGFAVKDIIENFLCGGILRVERTIRSGDLIVVKDQWMIVKDVGIRCTKAQTFDGVEILIPNSIVAHSVVANLTREGRSHRIRAQVCVTYAADPALVRRTLEAAVDRIDWRSNVHGAMVHLLAFEEMGVKYDVGVWIEDASDSERRRSDLYEVIWTALREEDITIAHWGAVRRAGSSEPILIPDSLIPDSRISDASEPDADAPGGLETEPCG